MPPRRKLAAALAASLMAVSGGQAAAASIDNSDATGWIGFFCPTCLAPTFGQTLRFATDVTMTGFRFRQERFTQNPEPGDDSDVVVAHVMRWDEAANRATGPVLFRSGTLSNAGAGDIVVDTGQLGLAAGDYVLFVTLEAALFGLDGLAVAFGQFPGAFPHGRFVAAGSTALDDLTSQSWQVAWDDQTAALAADFDLAFTVHLQPVPEPAALVLFGLGLAGLGLAFRQRG